MNKRLLLLLIVAAFVGGTDRAYPTEDNLAPIKAEITKRHDESVKRLQDWIGQVSIAAENRGYPEGAEYMAKLARDAGFQQATVINTDGKPGVFAPSAMQDLDGVVTVTLGSKGVIELELVSSGEKWGRGPSKDIHSSLKAMVDSPAWHLVKALDTLVSDDGNEIAIDNYPKPLPLSAEEKSTIEKVSKVRSEAQTKKLFSVQHWINNLPWDQANERLESQPTVNIEGLVGGYTGPGGKTILPHRAVAKIDMRLVPDMKAADALAALKAHLAKRGFGDIEVNMTGGYDPTSTSADSALIKAQVTTYKKSGIDALLWPRNAGSYPGYVFTGDPLKLAAGHFGLGHGSGAHAPDEYYIIESTNPKIQGLDGAVMSFVEYLYELAK